MQKPLTIRFKSVSSSRIVFVSVIVLFLHLHLT
nr:MAG TPA: hypothetical protein [Bacteriophage sp.]